MRVNWSGCVCSWCAQGAGDAVRFARIVRGRSASWRVGGAGGKRPVFEWGDRARQHGELCAGLAAEFRQRQRPADVDELNELGVAAG